MISGFYKSIADATNDVKAYEQSSKNDRNRTLEDYKKILSKFLDSKGKFNG